MWWADLEKSVHVRIGTAFWSRFREGEGDAFWEKDLGGPWGQTLKTEGIHEEAMGGGKWCKA